MSSILDKLVVIEEQDELSNYDKKNIIKTAYYIGISFSDTDLDIREYYLQRLNEVKWGVYYE